MEPLTDDQRKQLDDRDNLTRMCMFAVDSFVVDNRDDLTRVTGADQSRLIVEAAIGSLLENRLIAVTSDDERPEFVNCTLADHLRPDVAESVERLRRMNASLRGGS